MDSSADASRLEPLPQDRPAIRIPSVKTMLSRLFALPNDLGVAITITISFAAAVLLIAFVFDAPLVVPRERVSAALGVNAVLPFVFAIGVYVVLRASKTLLGKVSPDDPPLRQAVLTDVTLMALFLVVTYFHFSLKSWVQIINPHLYDAFYYSIDQELRPVINVFESIRTNVFELVPDADSWYQLAFLLMFIIGFCSLAITRDPVYPKFCIAVLLTMSLGGLSYLVAPALGPFIYEPGLNPEATAAQAGMLRAHELAVQHGMVWIAQDGSSYFTGSLAAMPSLHVAHAAVMTYFIRQSRSPLTAFFLLICFWVMIESVVSRWHYLIDLPAGLLLAAIVIWMTNRLCQDEQPAKRIAHSQAAEI